MKFIDLTKIDNKRNKTYEKFEEQLNEFRLDYRGDYEFELNYADKDHLIVSMDSHEEYNEEIHDKLCELFDVRLQYVNKILQQNPNTNYTTIEYIYSPVHHYTEYLEYKDVNL